MTVQYSEAVRNAKLDAYETAIGTEPILQIRSGAPPAETTDAATGTLLASITLPSDWMNAASAGSKTKSGTWEDASADANGTAGHYRLLDSTGTTCHEQGNITLTGGGGDMEVNNTALAAGQPFTVTEWTKTAGNA